MDEPDIFSFMEICEEFIQSSRELRDAAALCDDDPIKQEMIAFIIPDFEKLCIRSEGIKPLIERNYLENRDFITLEIKDLTQQNRKMAKLIREKLENLRWN